MKTYKVIDQLRLIDGELMCKKPSGRSYQKAHFKQGDLDGACGAYSISMVLNILGVFEADEFLCPGKDDKRTAKWKLIQALNEQGLYRNGLTSDKIQELLTKSYSSHVVVQCADKSQHNLIDLTKTWLENNIPIILGINYNSNDGHWIVVVGYALDENGELTNLLTLDPSNDSPKCSLWNGILNVRKEPRKKFGYQYCTNDVRMVDVEEAIIITGK
jgi:hypothetical protein